MRTPILWLAFLQIVPMWPVKLNLESIVTAKSLRFSPFFISSLFAQSADAALLIAWLYPMFIVWYFLRVPARRLESYHLVAARAPSLSLNETPDWSDPIWFHSFITFDDVWYLLLYFSQPRKKDSFLLMGTRAFSDRGPQSPKGVKIENNCLRKSLQSHHYLVFQKLCQKL